MFTCIPERRQLRVFARLPNEFRLNGHHSEWLFGKSNPNMHSFLEGPCFDADGNLYISDIPFGRIFRVAPDGSFELIVTYEGEPNGLAFGPDGLLYVADHRNGLVVVDPRKRSISYRLRRLRREGFKGLNSLVFAANGDLYFNDQGQTGLQDPTGRVYCLRTDGRVDCLIDCIPSPNGMALSPSGDQLYVAVTRANQVWRLPLHADGSTTKVNVFLHLQGGTTGPDGLATNPAGDLAVCQCGLGAVFVFSRLGEPKLVLRSPEGLDVTAAAFGGADGRTLYVTEAESGTILVASMADGDEPPPSPAAR